MKNFIIIASFLFANLTYAARVYNSCHGENEKYQAEFFIDDESNRVIVEIVKDGKSNLGIFGIVSDTTSSSYRPGEQRIDAIQMEGENLFNFSNSQMKISLPNIRIWIPNTYYYGMTRGDLSFFEDEPSRSNSKISFVQMNCEKTN